VLHRDMALAQTGAPSTVRTIRQMRAMVTDTERLIEADTLGYSRMYLDFIAGRSPAITFFSATDPTAAARNLDAISYNRERLHGLLKAQNSRFGSAAATLTNIEKMTDPRAVCVFAGQQAGLFGGPLMTLVKALAVVKAAKSYAERLQRPVIPVFWIAGDDHDFAEINHAWLPDRQGESQRLQYRTPPPHPVSAAEIRFADRDELVRVRQSLEEVLGQTDFSARLYDAIDDAYTPDADFVSAFGRFLVHATADTGLVLFNPADGDAKRLAASLFRSIIERQDAVAKALASRNAEIERSGYHLQVQKRDDAGHMFCNRNGRTPLLRSGDGFMLGTEYLTRKQVLDDIEVHSEMFSPDALVRPLLQSYLFPVILQLGGPSEIAYFAQMNPLFEVFELTAPVYRARPTLTVVEPRLAKTLSEHRIRFEELTGDFEQTINRILKETFPQDLERDLAALRHDIETRFQSFSERTLQFDPQLKDMAAQTQGKTDFLLKQFEAKVWASHKRKSGQTREKLYRLYHALYPNHGLQERSVNMTYFLAKYGPAIVRHMLDEMVWDETDHQLISLSENTPQ
jgi:bacillithiol synthase